MRRLTDEQVEEIVKCRDDPVYFLRTYLFLRHTTKGKIRWDHPYDYQVRVLQALHRGEDLFIVKSRRVGATWTACAYALYRTIFFPDIDVLLLSEKEFHAKRLLRRIKFMFNNLPAWMRPTIGANTQTEMQFVFRAEDQIADSNVVSLTTTKRAGAGEDAALAIMDEAASIPNADDVWAAFGPTASFGGQRVVISTPFGVGNFFHSVVTRLQAGVELPFTLVEAHWKRDCGLTDEWYAAATAGLSLQKRLQEFELQFISAGTPFFDLVKLEQCYKPLSSFPEMAEIAVPTKMNFTGVDTSEGRPTAAGEPDYHSVCVLNEFGVQIHAWHSNTMSLREFAGHTISTPQGRLEVEGIPTKIHREYPGAMVIERWGSGDVTASRHVVPDDQRSYIVLFRTTNQSKMRILHGLRQMINDAQIIITDSFTYQCMRAFEDQTQGIVEKAGASAGSFDDPVIALALSAMELHRYGGYQIDLTGMQTSDGRRMIGVRREEDLAPADMQSVLSVGDRAYGPLADRAREVPGDFRRLSDGIDDVRRGRSRVRPPGMR